MSQEAYELLALFMRYVFVLIGLLIVWRSLRWLLRDAKAYRRDMNELPDAGLVGEIVNLTTGEAQPLPREGTVGASRTCDICVREQGVPRVLARFAFEEGKGLKILPVRKAQMLLGGVPLRGAGYALHGTQVQFGPVALRVRLFAGLNVPRYAVYAEPDDIWDAGVSAPLWREADQDAEPLPPVPYLPPDQDAASLYDGDYDEDGQMTWQYAYSLDELRAQMDEQPWNRMQPTDTVPEPEEDAPYTSPILRRRRRSRHD